MRTGRRRTPGPSSRKGSRPPHRAGSPAWWAGAEGVGSGPQTLRTVMGRGWGAGVPRKRRRGGGRESARKTHTHLQEKGAKKTQGVRESTRRLQSRAERSRRTLSAYYLPGPGLSP